MKPRRKMKFGPGKETRLLSSQTPWKNHKKSPEWYPCLVWKIEWIWLMGGNYITRFSNLV